MLVQLAERLVFARHHAEQVAEFIEAVLLALLQSQTRHLRDVLVEADGILRGKGHHTGSLILPQMVELRRISTSFLSKL